MSSMCFFLFKQKTAYDMRISDWSSDVCSSDLAAALLEAREVVVDQLEIRLDGGASVPARVGPGQEVLFDGQVLEAVAPLHHLHHAGLYQVVGGQRIDAGALQLDRALGDLATLRAQQVGDRLQGGGLARTVGAQQGDDRVGKEVVMTCRYRWSP